MEVLKTQDELYRIPEMAHESGSIGYLEKIFIAQLILMSQAGVIVETGSFKGQTTRFLSRFLKLNNMAGTVYSFDLPEVIEGIEEKDPFFKTAGNVRFVKGRLPGTLRERFEGSTESVDFAIIDSEHSHTQVLAELDTLDPFLKKGAYVFCHDYREGDEKYRGVVRAVDEFAERRGYGKLPLQGRMVWGAAVLRKGI